MRTPTSRASTLIAALAAAACGSPSSTAPDGSTLCAGATAPRPIAAFAGSSRAMAARNGRLVVASAANVTDADGEVIVVDLADGTVSTLASGRRIGSGIAIGSSDAFWAELGPFPIDTAMPGALVRAPLDGSGTAEAVLSIGLAAFDMLFDRDTLYFGYERETKTSIAKLASRATAATDLVSDTSPLFFASDADRLYWTDCATGDVSGVPKAGGSPRSLASPYCPFGIATDGVDLFYADLYTESSEGVYVDAPQLHRVPVGGGADTIISEDAAPLTNLVLDGSNLYFGGRDGGLYRVAKAGGAAERLADGAVYNVAVDGACVYWTGDPSTVFTLPK